MPYAIKSILDGVDFIATTITNASTSSPFTNQGIKNLPPMTNQGIENLPPMTTGQIIIYFFILFVLLYFIMFIGSLVFNMSIVKIFPSVKKVSTIDFFGLYIVSHLLFC